MPSLFANLNLKGQYTGVRSWTLSVRAALLGFLFALASCNRATPTLVATPLPAAGIVPGVTVAAALVSGGETRTYRLHWPAGNDTHTPSALIVNLHGLGESAQEQEILSGMSAAADRDGYAVVYPEGRNRTWADMPGAAGAADRQFIADVIRQISTQAPIDPKRIYATGISNGGGMANRLACDMAGTFAAIAPVAGAYNYWNVCSPPRPVPILAFHGLADKVVPYSGAGRGELAPPIHDWAAAWAQRDGCANTPQAQQPAPGVKVETWGACRGSAVVALYTIADLGHWWPGSSVGAGSAPQPVNATDIAWAFFKQHPLP